MDLSVPLVNSLTLGSLYTLMALGLTMSFSVTKIANFAHAELVTIGGYVTALLVNWMGYGLGESLVAAFVASALLAVAMDEGVFKPMIRRGSRPLFLLVASIGVGLLIRYLLFIYADLNAVITLQAKTNVQLIGRLGRAGITTIHLWVFPITIVAVVLLHVMFHYTKPGKALRAMALGARWSELKRLLGVNPKVLSGVLKTLRGAMIVSEESGLYYIPDPVTRRAVQLLKA